MAKTPKQWTWKLAHSGCWYWFYKLDQDFTAVIIDDSAERQRIGGPCPTHYRIGCMATTHTFRCDQVVYLEFAEAKAEAIEFGIICRQKWVLAAEKLKSLPENI